MYGELEDLSKEELVDIIKYLQINNLGPNVVFRTHASIANLKFKNAINNLVSRLEPALVEIKEKDNLIKNLQDQISLLQNSTEDVKTKTKKNVNNK